MGSYCLFSSSAKKATIWMLTLGVFLAGSEGILYWKGYTLESSRDVFGGNFAGIISRQSRPLVVAPRPHNILAVGCSYTEAAGADAANNHISLLNGMLPTCNVDNAARDGSGPLESWFRLRQGLKLHHYDAAIYLFICHHLVRDMEYSVINSEDPEDPEQTNLYVLEHWELPEPQPQGRDYLLHYPDQRKVWPLDDRLRLVNFAKVFAYDIYGAWKSRQARHLQAVSPNEWAKEPWLLERFRRVLRGMQADCAAEGVKFGVVCLGGAGGPYSTFELAPPGPGERIPILDASYPVPFIPYNLCRDKDTVCFNHPNIDVYRYFAQKIAGWLKREGMIPAASEVLPVPPRFSMADTVADSDEVYPEDHHLVAMYLNGLNVAHRLRQAAEELTVCIRRYSELLPSMVEDSDWKRCGIACGHLEMNNGTNLMLARDVHTLGEILNKQKALPADLRLALAKCATEVAECSSGGPVSLSDYLEECATELIIHNNVLADDLQERSVNRDYLRYNRAVLRLARQLVHTKSAVKLQECLQEAMLSSQDLHSDNELSEDSIAQVRQLLTDIQTRLVDTPPEQLQRHIAKYGVPQVDNNAQKNWVNVDKEPDDGVYIHERTRRFPYEIVTEGHGRPARAGDLVTIHYECKLEDGTLYTSTRRRGVPRQYPLWAGYMVHGMEAGVDGMRVGEVRTFVVDPSLAYAPDDYGYVPAGHNLHYEVEMLDIKSPLPLLLNLNIDSIYRRSMQPQR